jgi:hypothetical protein
MRLSNRIRGLGYLWPAFVAGLLLFPLGGKAAGDNSRPASTLTPPPLVATRLPSQSTPARLFIGLAELPPESEGTSRETMKKWYGKAAAAGITMQQITPKWDELEPSEGTYDFHEFDFKAAMAKKFGLPVYLNLRIIDTLKRSMPKSYAAWRFDDPRMTAKLTALLQAIHSRNPAEIRWIAIGNEVDPYFMKHLDEVEPYRRLLVSLIPIVKKLFPGASVTVNFTFAGMNQLNKELKPIYDLTDILSVTYYPLNPDFTVRPPEDVARDFRLILASAGGKPVMFQEVGYPSSELLGSSPDKQAHFLQTFFDQMRISQPAVVGMTYLFMSDLPKALVDTFGQYYKLPGSDKFKAFLATLGLFDGAGNAKPAWAVFERNAKMQQSPSGAAPDK